MTDTGWITACSNGACIEAKKLTCDVIAIRDTEGGPTITVGLDSWEAFLRAAKAGVFDRVVSAPEG